MTGGTEVESERPRLAVRAGVVIFFLALFVRLLALVELADSPWNDVLLGDARHFDAWGQRIAAGDWRGDEVFYQAPLYPYFLGAVYAVFGHAPDLVRVLQCTLGALAAVWIAAGTVRFASPRAGLVAGVLAALYAPALWYDLQIEKTALASALTAVLFYLAVARAQSPALRWPFAAGLALGALTLLRENAAVLVLPLAWAFARTSRRARALAGLAAGLALVLVPVGWRNHALGGAFLPTSANTGVNFYIGNGAEADGQYRPLVAGRGHPDYEREDATRIAQDLAGRELSPAGVSAFWFGRAFDEIAAEPGHFVQLLLHKARLLLHRGEIMDAVAFEVFTDESLVLRVLGVLSFGVLFPLFLAGAALASGRAHAGFALASAVLVALSILLFFVVGRFRLGLVPFVIPFAAVALTGWRAPPKRVVPAAVLLVAGVLVSWWPLLTEGDVRAASASNLASELLRRGDGAAAEPWARRARERDPKSAEAAYNLGVALRQQEKHAEAAEPFVTAMRLEPAYSADCMAELGAIRALGGDEPGARSLLERALALEPAHAVARGYLEALDRSE